jgi:membrane-bound serine protease (ClpP class)
LNNFARLFLLAAIWLHLVAPLVTAQNDSGEVLVIDVDGPVTPVMLSFIERTVQQADDTNAEALVIRLNTPGGSVDLTKRIIQVIVRQMFPLLFMSGHPGVWRPRPVPLLPWPAM